jgi:hypothetical protein
MLSRSSSDARNAYRGSVTRGRVPTGYVSHRQAVDLDIQVSAADCLSAAPDDRAVKIAIRCSGGSGIRSILTPSTNCPRTPRGHTKAVTA